MIKFNKISTDEETEEYMRNGNIIVYGAPGGSVSGGPMNDTSLAPGGYGGRGGDVNIIILTIENTMTDVGSNGSHTTHISVPLSLNNPIVVTSK